MAKNAATAYLGLTDDDASADDGYDSEARELNGFERWKKRSRPSNDEESDHEGGDEHSKHARKLQRKDSEGSETPARMPCLSGSEQVASEHTIVASARSSTSQASSAGKEVVRQNQSAKSGVIYLSRVPPFLKPSALRTLLTPYGELGRIFLTPEDPSQYTARVKAGGNKKRSFTDGWVEFKRSRDAKLVAQALNAQIIGGKKGGWYHDDVWNIKYLKGFKWHHLTEQISNENAERAARMRTEIAQTKRENKRFVTNVERAKMLDTMQQKSKRKVNDDHLEYPSLSSTADHRERATHYEQVQVKTKEHSQECDSKSSAFVNTILNQIF